MGWDGGGGATPPIGVGVVWGRSPPPLSSPSSPLRARLPAVRGPCACDSGVRDRAAGRAWSRSSCSGACSGPRWGGRIASGGAREPSRRASTDWGSVGLGYCSPLRISEEGFASSRGAFESRPAPPAPSAPAARDSSWLLRVSAGASICGTNKRHS